jgi:hypothetical protein
MGSERDPDESVRLVVIAIAIVMALMTFIIFRFNL